MPAIRRILCPVDFSEASEHALRYAADLASALEADLHVIHAYQLPVYAMPDGAMMAGPEALTKLTDDLQKQLDALVARVSAARRIETHLVEGVPHGEIADASKRLGADMIVMGTHGRSGLQHFLLGSVAERVVRTAPIPVLTVRTPE